MRDLPQLTIELIQTCCSQQSFSRGEEYYRTGAIISPMLHKSADGQRTILTAECEGTSDQNYRVSVFLNSDGISDAKCSCPYDWGGYCKHIVALLLVYLNEPEKLASDGQKADSDFCEIAAKLIAQDKEDLVVLLLAMLNQEPGLLQLIRTYTACFQGYFSAKFLPSEEILKESYRLFVELAFSGRERALSAFGRGFVQDGQQQEVLEKLNVLKASAREKAQRGDSYFAALILEALVFGCLNRYEDNPNKREIFDFVSECLSLLHQALEQADLTPEKQQQWLLSLLSLRNRIELNHNVVICSQNAQQHCNANCPIELEWKLFDLILNWCKEEDVSLLLPNAQLEKELIDQEKARFRQAQSGGFCHRRRRNLIRFILRLYEIAQRTSDYLQLADSEGEGFLYVQKLIQIKEIDKAYRYIQEQPLNVDEYFPLAEKLESLGLNDKVHQLMEIGLQRACESKSASLYKFAEYFLAKRNYQLALSALVTPPLWAGGISGSEFKGEIKSTKKIRQVARRLGRWAEIRAKLTSELLAQQKYELLTHIYLDDGEIENAIATLRQVHPKPISGKDARVTGFRRNSLMRKVAKEAEKSHPKEAIRIYKKLAEAQIAKVDRRSYRRACLYLKKIKHLYTLLVENPAEIGGQTAKWREYIAKLRRQNVKKAAFWEEINEL